MRELFSVRNLQACLELTLLRVSTLHKGLKLTNMIKKIISVKTIHLLLQSHVIQQLCVMLPIFMVQLQPMSSEQLWELQSSVEACQPGASQYSTQVVNLWLEADMSHTFLDVFFKVQTTISWTYHAYIFFSKALKMDIN